MKLQQNLTGASGWNPGIRSATGRRPAAAGPYHASVLFF